jgi:uncharacterized protein (TIGR02452 family)
MNREQRIENARQTLDILKKGVYQSNKGEVTIADTVNRSIADTVSYTPKTLIEVLENVETKMLESKTTTTALSNRTTLEALRDAVIDGRTGCLNFASAKNPGGGFLNGALAQEETLAAASSLYPSLMKCNEMYNYNRSQNTGLYSDYMIYSPDVVFFKDDNGNLLDKPYTADVLTSPAVNVSSIKANYPKELAHVEQTMLARMDKMLALFATRQVENLVLGAWGCGVFQNDPRDIASYFARFLTRTGKYAKCFRQITFAVYDRSKNLENINAFREVFG